jgi:enamine deaminase RidA (YjgF/YER057c/UK114 family)
MKRRIVDPPELARPSGFSHGIVVEGGRLLFLAGQTGSDASGRIAEPGDLVAQFDRAIASLDAVARAAGGTLADVVKLNVFVRSRDDYVARLKPLGEVFRRRFGGHYPAMALFEVSGLFQKEALVELEGIAVVGRARAKRRTGGARRRRAVSRARSRS